MLKLIKTEGSTSTQRRIVRMSLDVRIIGAMTNDELRAVYPQLVAIENHLFDILERVDPDYV